MILKAMPYRMSMNYSYLLSQKHTSHQWNCCVQSWQYTLIVKWTKR